MHFHLSFHIRCRIWDGILSTYRKGKNEHIYVNDFSAFQYHIFYLLGFDNLLTWVIIFTSFLFSCMNGTQLYKKPELLPFTCLTTITTVSFIDIPSQKFPLSFSQKLIFNLFASKLIALASTSFCSDFFSLLFEILTHKNTHNKIGIYRVAVYDVLYFVLFQ